MTDDKLLRANNIKHELGNVEAQMEIVANMEEDHCTVSLYNSKIGSVTLSPDLRDEILGIVLNSLVTRAGELRDEFRML